LRKPTTFARTEEEKKRETVLTLQREKRKANAIYSPKLSNHESIEKTESALWHVQADVGQLRPNEGRKKGAKEKKVEKKAQRKEPGKSPSKSVERKTQKKSRKKGEEASKKGRD